jgi:hypothetical protein
MRARNVLCHHFRSGSGAQYQTAKAVCLAFPKRKRGNNMQNYKNYLENLNAERERLSEFLSENLNKTNGESAQNFLNFLQAKQENLSRNSQNK